MVEVNTGISSADLKFQKLDAEIKKPASPGGNAGSRDQGESVVSDHEKHGVAFAPDFEQCFWA